MNEIILLLTREQGGQEIVKIAYKDYVNILSNIAKTLPIDEESKKVFEDKIKKYVREVITLRIFKILKNEKIPKNTLDFEILELIDKIIKIYEDILCGKIVLDGKSRVSVKVLRDYNLDSALAREFKIPQKLKKEEILIMPLRIAIPLIALNIVEVRF